MNRKIILTIPVLLLMGTGLFYTYKKRSHVSMAFRTLLPSTEEFILTRTEEKFPHLNVVRHEIKNPPLKGRFFNPGIVIGLRDENLPEQELRASDPVLYKGTTRSFMNRLQEEFTFKEIPLAVDIQGLVYNREIFHNYNIPLPRSIEELENAFRILKSEGITPLTLAGKEDRNLTAYLSLLTEASEGAAGYSVFKENPSEIPGKVQALLKKWKDRGWLQKEWMDLKDKEVSLSLDMGKSAMSIRWFSETPSSWGFMSFPVFEGRRNYSLTTRIITASLVKDSWNKNSGEEVLPFFMDEDFQKELASSLGFVTARTDIPVANSREREIHNIISSAHYLFDLPRINTSNINALREQLD